MSEKKPEPSRRAATRTATPEDKAASEAELKLRACFHARGILEMPDPALRPTPPKRRKDYRVRLIVESDEAAAEIQASARRVGLDPGESFRDGLDFVVPINGAKAVAWFLTPVGGAIPPKARR